MELRVTLARQILFLSQSTSSGSFIIIDPTGVLTKAKGWVLQKQPLSCRGVSSVSFTLPFNAHTLPYSPDVSHRFEQCVNITLLLRVGVKKV